MLFSAHQPKRMSYYVAKTPFNLADIEQECRIETGVYLLDNRTIGMKVFVPEALFQSSPFNSNAYRFLQQLRSDILEYGTIEFPNLPVNRSNYTLAQRAPQQHLYSSNTYLTDYCQQPHQDTPPYPTAFWLGAKRENYATWVLSLQGLKAFSDLVHKGSEQTTEQLHRHLVQESLNNKTGLLLNKNPGLLLIDNSEHNHLYHARTCKLDIVGSDQDSQIETPMYAYNEMGLIHHIDQLDSRRGRDDLDDDELENIKDFLSREHNPNLYTG